VLKQNGERKEDYRPKKGANAPHGAGVNKDEYASRNAQRGDYTTNYPQNLIHIIYYIRVRVKTQGIYRRDYLPKNARRAPFMYRVEGRRREKRLN